ncbi:MAG TPA: polysaccharide biosynthesis/export family protein [Verrucomicrobiae bacterium]|nr:polysaccharide biosynthesis/export family protein [Verrucomicrobiae bacterium]
MNDEQADVVIDASPSEPMHPAGTVYGSLPRRQPAVNPGPSPTSKPSFRPADAWLFIEVLREHWSWIMIGGVLCAMLGFAASWVFWKPAFIASARLIRNESPRTAEVFTYQTLTPQTYVSLLRSPELMSHVARLANPPIPTEAFVKRLRLTPEREGDVVLVEFAAGNKEAAMKLANLYATEAVIFTQQLQSNAANEVLQFVSPQLEQVASEIASLKNEKRALPQSLPTVSAARPSPLDLKVRKAQEELVEVLTQYTETHPMAQAARAKVEALQQQQAKGEEPAPLPSESEIAGQFAVQRDVWEMVRSELQPLESSRYELMKRQRSAALVANEPPGYYRMLSPALLQEVKGSKRELKIGIITIFFGVAGVIGFTLLALLIEVMDQRLKVPADVTRVTGLPVIGTAPDLDLLSHIEQRNWAFKTWKRLQGRLSQTLNHGLVCGVTSSTHGEGRSTLVRSLARAASESGFRVLTVSTRHEVRNGRLHAPSPEKPTNGHANGHNLSVTMNTLPTPAEVEEKLVGPHSQPVVHIPLPGWVWNLDRRKQWQATLEEWRKIENVVILIELPPASHPEAILLAEEIPNVLWLADSGGCDAEETRAQLETLRHARCNLVGAVLNHAPAERVRNRFARWLPGLLFGLLASTLNAQQYRFQPFDPVPAAPPTVQTNIPPPAPTPTVSAPTNPTAAAPIGGSFLGGSAPTERAPWQERFTLGPGDILRISLYGSPEFTKADVTVAPDGRVAFLEAQDVMASGLTIDEFRQALDKALSEFRRAPRTMVSPVTFHSKRYYILGKVNQRGVYSLEQSTTVLEAIALAKGFEVGLRERDSFDLVDLQRSFLMRDGKRVPINFERMFLDGDLSQNITLAPNDYLFFPPGRLQEVHVLGDVNYPGSVTYTPKLGVIGAITVRAGFVEKAYKSKVLVVRGGLDNPQTFVVNCNDILNGKTPDFLLEPKDIVYVYKRPWYRAEEILDLAITAFLQSVVATYTGQEIIQPFTP